STLSRLSTTENSISIPAEFRQSRSLFPISRLPPAEAYLTESLDGVRPSIASGCTIRYYRVRG
ncbi:MAG: hypothetical protein ACLQVL_35540, partial [Terriglobia bacterium]